MGRELPNASLRRLEGGQSMSALPGSPRSNPDNATEVIRIVDRLAF